jgi:hypothetical protein
MKKRVLIILLVVALIWQPCSAQNKFSGYSFQSVDSFAMSIKYEKDIFKLAKDLAAPYSEDIYKVRSIFRWVADNIEYDYEFINKDKERTKPNCEGSIDCSRIIKEWEEDYVKDILKHKKAICYGYARTFQKLCSINGIRAEIISGYVKNKPYQIGNSLSANHAWNAVMLDSVWYYLDPTWAAGYVSHDEDTDKLLNFKKVFKNYYWLTPFNRLVRNHYPQNGKWVETANFTKEKFFNQPHYFGLQMLEKISNEISPSTGVLQVKKDSVIHFKFDYVENLDKLQINSNTFTNPPLWNIEEDENGRRVKRIDTSAIRRQVYIPYVRKGHTYEFDYVVKEQSLYYLELIFDNKKAMRYKVSVSE